MGPKIVFSPHALGRTEEREISPKLVEEAVKFPDKIERSSISSSRFLIKKLYFNEKLKKDHLLLIVAERKKNLIEVVTIIDTSKISKYF